MQTETTSNKIVTPSSADGYSVGQSATDKVGFYGATPVAQRAGAAQAAVTTTAATSTTPFGYSEAQANAIVALVNEMRAALVALGIIKGAA
jgi:UDP-N-acetyl-D-mannosaminuronic acid transferase (WecB/TagA/CpsF family)